VGRKAEFLKVEAILAASTFFFPYKIHVPMLVVWGSDASTFLLAAKIHADHIKSGKKKAHSWVQHKNQSKINTVGGEASQNIPGIQHQGGLYLLFARKWSQLRHAKSSNF
jgi:hypothetical protein